MSESSIFINHLNFICSSNKSTSYRSLNFILNMSLLNPSVIISNIDAIKLLISTLSHSREPNWGTISSIIIALSNAVSICSGIQQETMVKLINISYEITNSFLHTTSIDYVFRPHMFPFIDTIFQKINNGEIKMSLDILLAISDHCSIGFLPYVTFIPVLLASFQQIESIVLDCDATYYDRLTMPIESPDIEVVFFYISLWVIVIKDLITRPRLIQSLMRHSKTLLEYSESSDSALSKTSRFLLDCVKALTPQISEVKRISEENRTKLLTLLEKRMAYKNELLGKELMKPKNNQKTYFLFRTTGEVFMKKGKKWKQYEIVIVEEARIFMWSDNKSRLHDGVAIHKSEIKDVILCPQKSKEYDKENIIKINMKKGVEYLISFKTYKEASQWRELIDEM